MEALSAKEEYDSEPTTTSSDESDVSGSGSDAERKREEKLKAKKERREQREKEKKEKVANILTSLAAAAAPKERTDSPILKKVPDLAPTNYLEVPSLYCGTNFLLCETSSKM